MATKPSICILVSQYFGWGIYGGFGSMSRQLAQALQQAGYQVTVVVPRRPGQQPIEIIGGVEVWSFAALNLAEAVRLLRRIPADIFHSQDPTLITYLAEQVRPECIHLITCIDPRDWYDWSIEFRYATHQRRLLMAFHYLTESGYLVGQAVRAAQGVFCPAHFLRAKVQRMYRLSTLPNFLPNLVDVPTSVPRKLARPTFVFVARFDKRKRPEMFFELARQFPEYNFVAVGQGSALAERAYDESLRRKYRDISNLKMTGLINRFSEGERLSQVLADSWVLINTAAREGLPLTFLEAAAHGCAVLSGVNPDGFAVRFGEWAADGNYGQALQKLMQDSPLEKGLQARQYVLENYERERAFAAHLAVYHQVSATAF